MKRFALLAALALSALPAPVLAQPAAALGHPLPDGKIVMPGVLGHASREFVEHPETVAQRLIRYAELVGKENVIAGTDCGIGTRVGHPSLGWAKFRAMRDGAALASKVAWG